MIIRNAILKLITRSPLKSTKEFQKISKPALQKAEIEWNKEYIKPVKEP